MQQRNQPQSHNAKVVFKSVALQKQKGTGKKTQAGVKAKDPQRSKIDINIKINPPDPPRPTRLASRTSRFGINSARSNPKQEVCVKLAFRRQTEQEGGRVQGASASNELKKKKWVKCAMEMEFSSLRIYFGIALTALAIAYPIFLLVVSLGKEKQSEAAAEPVKINDGGTINKANGETDENTNDNNNSPSKPTQQDKTNLSKKNDNGWQCACEGGGIFLPASLMKSLGGPGAAMRMGAGGCYHKQM